MPKHSKEQILAALQGIIGEDSNESWENSTAAARTFVARHASAISSIAKDEAGRARSDGMPSEVIDELALLGVAIYSVAIGFCAAQRLQEIDELEAMEAVDA